MVIKLLFWIISTSWSWDGRNGFARVAGPRKAEGERLDIDMIGAKVGVEWNAETG